MADNNFEPKNAIESPIKPLLASLSTWLSIWLISSHWLFFTEFVKRHPGIIAVLIGVAGEIWFDWKKAESKWEKVFMALLVLGLTYELREAADEDRKTGELQATNAMLVASNQYVAGQLVIAQSNLAALQLRVQWRTVTLEQETNLITLLKSSAGHRRVLINVEGADNPEAEAYADRLNEVLKECDFDVTRINGLNVGVIHGGGLVMNVKDRNRPPPHAIPIINAFKSQGLALRAEENPTTEEGVVYFWVLPKANK